MSSLAANHTDDIGRTLLTGISIAGRVAACLIGAALLARHPDALRTQRVLAVGSALIALSMLGTGFRVDAFAWFDSLVAMDTFGPNPYSVAYGALVSLAAAGGLYALGRGLDAARVLPSGLPVRRLGLVALAIVLAASAIGVATFVSIGDQGDFLVANVVSISVDLVSSLALASLAVTALIGAGAGEQPPAGWWLTALAAWGTLGLRLGTALVSVLLLAAPDVTVGAAANLFVALSVAGSAMWVVLLLAFATGLPANQRRAS